VRRALVLALLAGLGARHARAEGTVDTEIDAGRTDFEAGRYEDATVHFARARALAPDDWRGHAFQALAMLQHAAAEPDPDRRALLVEQAQAVAAVLVKRRLCGFDDPLFRFLSGVALAVLAQPGQACDEFATALRAPAATLARYEAIDLHTNLKSAYVRTVLQVTGLLVRMGRFDRADEALARIAPFLPEGGPDRVPYERLRAVVCEQIGKYDAAIDALRACLRLEAKTPGAGEELRGWMAQVHFAAGQLDEGRKVLDAVAASTHPEVVTARCVLQFKLGMRAPEQQAAAIDALRKAIPELPPEDRYLVVELFARLARARAEAAGADAERALLEEAVRLLIAETGLRPAYPPPYFQLSTLSRLLGDEDQARRLEETGAQRQKAWEDAEKFDDRGRPLWR